MSQTTLTGGRQARQPCAGGLGGRSEFLPLARPQPATHAPCVESLRVVCLHCGNGYDLKRRAGSGMQLNDCPNCGYPDGRRSRQPHRTSTFLRRRRRNQRKESRHRGWTALLVRRPLRLPALGNERVVLGPDRTYLGGSRCKPRPSATARSSKQEGQMLCVVRSRNAVGKSP